MVPPRSACPHFSEQTGYTGFGQGESPRALGKTFRQCPKPHLKHPQGKHWHFPQIPIDDSLADPPTILEVAKALGRFSSGKASVADSIAVEVYKTLLVAHS